MVSYVKTLKICIYPLYYIVNILLLTILLHYLNYSLTNWNLMHLFSLMDVLDIAGLEEDHENDQSVGASVL